jgi:hypothetical protein
MATYDASSTESGVSFDDIWDETALTSFDPVLDLTSMHCPVLAAQAKLVLLVVSEVFYLMHSQFYFWKASS